MISPMTFVAAWIGGMSNETATADSSFHQDRSPTPGAQGQAALLLVESLIHSLLDNGALTKYQAIEAIENALQVKEDSADELKEPSKTLRRSVTLLTNMQNSIRAHSGRYDPSPDAGPQERRTKDA
jgi:hypothetical protein